MPLASLFMVMEPAWPLLAASEVSVLEAGWGLSAFSWMRLFSSARLV